MILIDIPMPENCGDCRLMASGRCVPMQADSHTNRFRPDTGKRPEWCPLKEGDDGEEDGNL